MSAVPSQRQLAIQLGVSPMTVSRVLRGSEGVSPALREQILSAARASGLPTPAAARHRDAGGLLHVVCTMAPEPNTQGSDSPFHGRLLDGLRRGARECASEIVNCPEVNQVWPLVVLRKQVDGSVMVWGDEHDPKPSTICPVPSVYVFYGPPHADVVTVDNFGGALEIGRYLAAMGHRRVAFVGPDSRIALERLSGLRVGLEAGGGSVLPHLTLLERAAAGEPVRLADHLLDAARRDDAGRLEFTAVMAYNDYSAAGVAARFAEMGIEVPGQVSVAGFDGVSPNSYDGPRICTSAIPLEEVGAEAARMVYWRIDHPAAVRRILALETHFMKGETVMKIDSPRP